MGPLVCSKCGRKASIGKIKKGEDDCVFICSSCIKSNINNKLVGKLTVAEFLELVKGIAGEKRGTNNERQN